MKNNELVISFKIGYIIFKGRQIHFINIGELNTSSGENKNKNIDNDNDNIKTNSNITPKKHIQSTYGNQYHIANKIYNYKKKPGKSMIESDIVQNNKLELRDINNISTTIKTPAETGHKLKFFELGNHTVKVFIYIK